VQDSVSFILHPHISGELFQIILTTLWFISRARNEQRCKQKTWTVWQVHHTTAAKIQGTKLVNFAGDDQNPTTTTQLEELGEQSTTMAKQQKPLQEVNWCLDASIPPEQQLLGPTLAGLDVYIPKLQSSAQSVLLIKAQAQDASGPLQAEALATQLATQVMTSLHEQRCKIFQTESNL
jgi:hypothetical protein